MPKGGGRSLSTARVSPHRQPPSRARRGLAPRLAGGAPRHIDDLVTPQATQTSVDADDAQQTAWGTLQVPAHHLTAAAEFDHRAAALDDGFPGSLIPDQTGRFLPCRCAECGRTEFVPASRHIGARLPLLHERCQPWTASAAGPTAEAVMKIASWNVNSLKVRLPQLLQAKAPDIVGLQEAKLVDDSFPTADIEDAG